MMIEETVRERLNLLINEGEKLRIGDGGGVAIDEEHKFKCVAWLAPAQNLIKYICPDAGSIYRSTADELAKKGIESGWYANHLVGGLTDLMKHLLADVDSGLLSSLVDNTRAETFDDFLEHAERYMAKQKKNEAGVIAGVVFEDTLRRICDKNHISQKGVSLEDLINTLTRTGNISALKAKRAKASAHVRTKATHAQWDEFELSDVDATITFTRELISSKLSK